MPTVDSPSVHVKVARPDHPIHDLIARRWSPRAFSEQPVPDDLLLSLLEAARWAASARNTQPWSFILTTEETRAGLISCLADFNRPWAQRAPVLGMVVANLSYADGTPNRWAVHDCGAALATLSLQAAAFDLHVRQMGSFDAEQARALFAVPPGHDPVVAFALGYLGDPAALPADQAFADQTARSRRPLSDFVFSDGWGHTAPLVRD